MARRGANQPSVGAFNQAVVLEQIRRSRGMSRVELVGATGLSAQTVSSVCQRLLDGGIIVEAERSTSTGRGKPRTILRLVGDSRLAVGVHLDPEVITIVLLGIDGTMFARVSHAIAATGAPEGILALITDQIDHLLSAARVDRARIVGIGVAAPGPIDADRGAVLNPPNLGAWHDVPVRDSMRASTGLPIILDKDVTAAAIAERWVAPHGDTSFAFLYLGTGVGVGLMIGDDVVRGVSGNAGEIGHLIVDGDGPPCTCGRRGCVAVTCTPAAVIAEARALGIFPARDAGEARAAHDGLAAVAAFAANGDVAAIALLDRVASRISSMLGVVCNLLDVDRVVLGGPMWTRLAPWLEGRVPPTLTGQLVADGLHHIVVSGTSLGDDAGAIGAACLVLDDAMTPRTASLLLS